MDKHVGEHYHQYTEGGTQGNFHTVIPLHLHNDEPWEKIELLETGMPRGWHELARLPDSDRIEFLREFWLSKLPFIPATTELIGGFFERLDSIAIFIVQQRAEGPYETHLVYSLADDGGFFWGRPPVTPEAWAPVQRAFEGTLFPEDYLAFLQIHDGFGKHGNTGTMPSTSLLHAFEGFQQYLVANEPLRAPWGELVDPKTLIPFYESYGLHCYQCFWAEWYPGSEMGNVYYSGIEKSLSIQQPDQVGAETQAFGSFLDWLAFYIEAVY